MHHPPPPDLSEFDLRPVEDQAVLTRIGCGAVGAKAEELQHVLTAIEQDFDPSEFPGIEVEVPRAIVLTSELFDAFMRSNGIFVKDLAERSDDEILSIFSEAAIPDDFAPRLHHFVNCNARPLAIRSSVVLGRYGLHPLTDVFATKLIPNHQNDPAERYREFERAIKLVWASAFFAKAQAYLRTIGHPLDEESMAVIVQEVAGRRYGDRFYPCISGVARSFNFYTTGRSAPEEGLVVLALGLGKTISDGGLVWSYVPAYPNAPPPFYDLGDLLKSTQTTFWAIDMGPRRASNGPPEAECLVQGTLERAKSDGVLKYLVSTYHLASDRLHSGLSEDGPHALTFAPVLASDLLGLNRLISRLTGLLGTGFQGPVEVEFAVDLDPEHGLPAKAAVLQAQPLPIGRENTTIESEELDRDDLLVASESVLGNGSRDFIRDIVYLKPDTFDVAFTRLITHELAAINSRLEESETPYLLIGFGRWGTADPWLGMPVEWNQVSGARVIVEATLSDIEPDISQGSRFFQYLLSYRVLYLAVEHEGPGSIDWDWLNRQEVVEETDFVVHVRTRSALDIRVDGAHGRGVIVRSD